MKAELDAKMAHAAKAHEDALESKRAAAGEEVVSLRRFSRAFAHIVDLYCLFCRPVQRRLPLSM